MKDYRKMSDAEINQLITCFQFDCHDWPQNINGDFYHCGFDGDSYFVIAVKDYCNNPSDSWPIIIENSITFNYDTAQVHVGSYFSDTAKLSENRSKALRAAMIVYLMMKDEE